MNEPRVGNPWSTCSHTGLRNFSPCVVYEPITLRSLSCMQHHALCISMISIWLWLKPQARSKEPNPGAERRLWWGRFASSQPYCLRPRVFLITSNSRYNEDQYACFWARWRIVLHHHHSLLLVMGYIQPYSEGFSFLPHS